MTVFTNWKQAVTKNLQLRFMLEKYTLLDARKKPVTTTWVSISKCCSPNAYCALQFSLRGTHVLDSQGVLCYFQRLHIEIHSVSYRVGWAYSCHEHYCLMIIFIALSQSILQDDHRNYLSSTAINYFWIGLINVKIQGFSHWCSQE